jgi:hypothetical protein
VCVCACVIVCVKKRGSAGPYLTNTVAVLGVPVGFDPQGGLPPDSHGHGGATGCAASTAQDLEGMVCVEVGRGGRREWRWGEGGAAAHLDDAGTPESRRCLYFGTRTERVRSPPPLPRHHSQPLVPCTNHVS